MSTTIQNPADYEVWAMIHFLNVKYAICEGNMTKLCQLLNEGRTNIHNSCGLHSSLLKSLKGELMNTSKHGFYTLHQNKISVSVILCHLPSHKSLSRYFP